MEKRITDIEAILLKERDNKILTVEEVSKIKSLNANEYDEINDDLSLKLMAFKEKLGLVFDEEDQEYIIRHKSFDFSTVWEMQDNLFIPENDNFILQMRDYLLGKALEECRYDGKQLEKVKEITNKTRNIIDEIHQHDKILINTKC